MGCPESTSRRTVLTCTADEGDGGGREMQPLVQSPGDPRKKPGLLGVGEQPEGMGHFPCPLEELPSAGSSPQDTAHHISTRRCREQRHPTSLPYISCVMHMHHPFPASGQHPARVKASQQRSQSSDGPNFCSIPGCVVHFLTTTREGSRGVALTITTAATTIIIILPIVKMGKTESQRKPTAFKE